MSNIISIIPVCCKCLVASDVKARLSVCRSLSVCLIAAPHLELRLNNRHPQLLEASIRHLQTPPMGKLINLSSLQYICLAIASTLLCVTLGAMFFSKNKMPVHGKVRDSGTQYNTSYFEANNFTRRC